MILENLLNNEIAKYKVLNFSDSFIKNNRIDSAYYAIKYENLENIIKGYKNGFITLQDEEIIDKNFIPNNDEYYRYIELANIMSNGEIDEPEITLGRDLPSRARRIVKSGDLIISSVEGSLSKCAIITDEFDGCLVSTGFYVIRSNRINNATLFILFKNDFFQEYLKKFPSGTILTAINKNELKKILIPNFEQELQIKIKNLFEQILRLRKQGKDLSNKTKLFLRDSVLN